MLIFLITRHAQACSENTPFKRQTDTTVTHDDRKTVLCQLEKLFFLLSFSLLWGDGGSGGVSIDDGSFVIALR